MPTADSDIAAAVRRLRAKLLALDLAGLGLSDYNLRYLTSKLRLLDANLDLYAAILREALGGLDCPPERLTLVDYGGGSGMLGFLAREAGVGTVVYTDIYDVSCRDVRQLERGLGLRLDHVVCGDIGELVVHLRDQRLAPQVIASFDVIEHIYDVERHFAVLGEVCEGGARVVYASSANIRNPYYVRKVTPKQRAAELTDRPAPPGAKERDTRRAWWRIRRELIAQAAPQLDERELDELASRTRGLISGDVLAAVAEYLREGSIRYQPSHPTNTCDPLTGNWCENLLEPEWLESMVARQGFRGKILAGRWSLAEGRTVRRLAKRLINRLMDVDESVALRMAPYYILVAERLSAGAASGMPGGGAAR